MRHWISLVYLLIAVPSFAGDRPNFIVIFTDDHGYADLGCQDVLPDVRTPHIDALAAGGARMTNGYVTAPQCVPSRGGLLTGLYQNSFGLESNTQGQQDGGLNGFNEAQTIAERLRDAGYVTGMAGKWHLGPVSQIAEHGFDKVFYRNSARPGFANFDLKGNDTKPGPESSGMYHIDACSAAASAFIRKHQNQPFFFYLAYRAPHVPLDAPEKYLKRFPGKMAERRRKALAMLSAVDDGVGIIVDTLRQCGIEENTLIFFISDNGAPLKIHKLDAPGGGPGWDGSLNDPLNGEKGMLSEGGIRTPFVVSWKGRIAPQEYAQPVVSLDVAATLQEVATGSADKSLHGVNLIPYLTNNQSGLPHESLYWRWNGQAAIRKGKWKYLTVGNREWLFDLNDDVGETKSLIKEHPEIAKTLRSEWDVWAADMKPPGLPTNGSSTAHNYFDWYLDGKRGMSPPKPKKLSSQTPSPGDKQKKGLSDPDLFRARDKNKDDRVTWEEFLNGRSGATVEPLRRRFEARDKDGNGVWEKSELKPAKQNENDSASMNKTASASGDVNREPRPKLPADAKHPNIVMILADDLGYSDTTLYGHTKFYRTPNLQRLRERGMLFTRAYANSPLCSPTRASLLTGQTPLRHGSTAPQHHLPKQRLKAALKSNAPAGNKAIEPDSVSRLDTSIPTLGKVLYKFGYRTGHFGKWHLGPEPFSPLQHGFEVDIPHHPGPGPAGSYVAPWKFRAFKEKQPKEHLEDRMAAEAAEWIQAVKDEPFYLNYWQFSVHAPFDAKQSLIDEYSTAVDSADEQRCPTYAAMVHSLDDAVGTLMSAIDEAGVAERTVFVFVSDNGGNMYNKVDGEVPTSNRPLRGGKATIYEGGIRGPGIVIWPGETSPETTCDTPIQTSDFYPTILSQLGLPIPEGHTVDGVDISPLLRGETIPERSIFTYFPHSPPVPDWLPPSVAIHRDNWKLIRLFHQGEDGGHEYRLYDLDSDIGETTNLAGQHSDLVQQLDAAIEQQIEASNAVVPVLNPRFEPAKYRPELIGVGRIRK